MSKKAIITALVVVLVIAAAVVGFFVYTNLTEEPAEVVQQQENVTVPDTTEEESTSTTTNKVMLSGTFQDGDAVHSGEGTAEVVETDEGPVLSFGSDFKVTNGPDLFVYLSPNPAGEDLGNFASLGRLKSSSGAQAYNLPANYQDYQTVVIWCRAFSVTFATAELQ